MLTSNDFMRLGIINDGNEVKVPKNKLAKLMYYLDCVFSILDCPGLDFYRNYKNYHNLTTRQTNEVLVMCARFEPSLMKNYHLFIQDKDLLPMGFGNQFYDIKDNRVPYSVRRNVLIGGRDFKVLQVMACNQAWIDENYNEPMALFASVWCCFCCDQKCRDNCCNCCNKSCKCCWITIFILFWICIALIIYSAIK